MPTIGTATFATSPLRANCGDPSWPASTPRIPANARTSAAIFALSAAVSPPPRW
ncbi:hypothetical protein [Candidatus Frankia alpina]|uniref:hypothetical protein n=1 Tax=Candidatus Frankia alpina TaxID=2699483 RepID=UPI0039A3EE8B